MIGPVAGGVVYEYMGFQMATFFIVVMFVAIVSWYDLNDFTAFRLICKMLFCYTIKGSIYTIHHVIDQFILGNYWNRTRGGAENPPADSEEAPLISNRAN